MDTALPRGHSSSTARSGKAAPEGALAGRSGVATLRYWAAAREAAGTAQEETRATTLGRALSEAVAARGTAGEPLARVLRRCSFLIDGAPVGTRDPETVEVRAGAVVEVLPPFAGG
jgi:molybdopterin converting factor small subunit